MKEIKPEMCFHCNIQSEAYAKSERRLLVQLPTRKDTNPTSSPHRREGEKTKQTAGRINNPILSVYQRARTLLESNGGQHLPGLPQIPRTGPTCSPPSHNPTVPAGRSVCVCVHGDRARGHARGQGCSIHVCERVHVRGGGEGLACAAGSICC